MIAKPNKGEDCGWNKYSNGEKVSKRDKHELSLSISKGRNYQC